MSKSLAVLFAAACLVAATSASYIDHYSGDSTYIHSNDTIQLTLLEGVGGKPSQQLSGPPGFNRRHRLELALVNRESAAGFTLKFESADGIQGSVEPSNAYLNRGEQKVVSVRLASIPQRPAGTALTFSVTAKRNSPYNRRDRREAQLLDEDAKQKIGEALDDAVQETKQVGEKGIDFIKEMVGGQGNYNGGGAGGIGGADDWVQPRDPSYRKKVRLSAIFTVTEDAASAISDGDDGDDFVSDDDDDPEAEEDRVDGCSVQYDDPNCHTDTWWVRFQVQDDGVGLNTVEVAPKNSPRAGVSDSVVYYRYKNFPLGYKERVEVMAEASCCVEEITLRATDLNLNEGLEDSDNFDEDEVDDKVDDEGSNNGSSSPVKGAAAFAVAIATAVAAAMAKIAN